MAERQEAIRHAEGPASAAEDLAVAAATHDNRSFNLHFLADFEIRKWREGICGEQSRTSAIFTGPVSLNWLRSLSF
jgi:hypothetical protein